MTAFDGFAGGRDLLVRIVSMLTRLTKPQEPGTGPQGHSTQ